MIRSPALRAISTIFGRSAYTASLDKAFLDPNKHITMNHFPHFVYVDYWPIGQYPETYTIGSVPSAAYQPQIEKIIIETLNSRYNVNHNVQEIVDLDFDKLFTHSLKTQQKPADFIDVVLSKLAQNIVVKESGWTWVKEQQVRASTGSKMFNINQCKNLSQFLAFYNEMIEQLVLISNFGQSPKIPQELTAQQKHYLDESSQNITGIADLNQIKPEYDNFINRFMKKLHTL